MSQMVAKKPPWRDYLVAHLLIGGGFSVVDAFAGPSGNVGFEIVGVTILIAGLLVFVAALGNSVSFVLSGKQRRNGICAKCSYDLTGNTSGVCPECGRAISKTIEVKS